MSVHLERQMKKIRQLIGAQSERVSDAVHRSILAAEARDADLAQRVIEADTTIDRAEVDIEEEVLHALACYQPVAFDLRYLISVLKMNNDLERIADQAVNIAELAQFMAGEPPINWTDYVNGMTEQVQAMLRQAREALLEADDQKADAVRSADDRVDTDHRRMYEQVETVMRQQPEKIPQLIHLMNVSRQLERIGDLAVNIAEDIVYMVRGEILRHRPAISEAS